MELRRQSTIQPPKSQKKTGLHNEIVSLASGNSRETPWKQSLKPGLINRMVNSEGVVLGALRDVFCTIINLIAYNVFFDVWRFVVIQLIHRT